MSSCEPRKGWARLAKRGCRGFFWTRAEPSAPMEFHGPPGGHHVGTASGIVKEAAAPTRESRRRRDGMDGATADVPQTIRVIWSGDGFWHVTKRTGRSWSGPAAWDRGRGRRRGRSGARWPGTAANGRDCVGVPIYLARPRCAKEDGALRAA